MNTVYRVVWNAELCQWVVASEMAKGLKKRSSSTKAKATAAVLTAITVAGVAVPAFARTPAVFIVNDVGFGTVDTGGCNWAGGDENQWHTNTNCSTDPNTKNFYNDVRQTTGVVAAVNAMSVGGYQFINGVDTSGNALTLTASGGNLAMNQGKVINLVKGTADQDSVNVSQLKGVTDAIGGGAGVNPDGTINAPVITIGGNTYDNTTEAIEKVYTSGIKYFHANGGTMEDSQAIGDLSIAIGPQAKTVGLHSTAMGFLTSTASADDIAIGSYAKTISADSGSPGTVTGSVAIGTSAVAKGGGVAVGSNAKVNSSGQVAFGVGAEVTETGGGGTAFGTAAKVTGNSAVAIGNTSGAAGAQSLAIGTLAKSDAASSVAIGYSATAKDANSVALGRQSTTKTGAQTDYTAAYLAAKQSSIGEVSVGTASGQRTISGVSAGKDDYDAVNVSQLKSAIESIPGGVDALKWDSTNNVYNAAHDGTNPNKIVNVANGTAGKDAVNVDQLKGIADVIGGGTTIDPTTGKVTPPVIGVNGKDGTEAKNVVDALQGLDGRVAAAQDGIDGLDGKMGELANTPITFEGNDGSVGKKLGETLSVQGTASTAGTYSGNNLKTVVDANGVMQLQMADAPKFGNIVINKDGEGRIAGVSDALSADEAVNNGQMEKAIDDATIGINPLAVSYDSAAKDVITLKGTDGTTIANVAAGKDGKDAVNVDQLKGIADVIGGGTTVDPTTGKITPPVIGVNGKDGKDATNVVDALQGLDGRVAAAKDGIDGLDGKMGELANTPITFKGNSGEVGKKLGDTLNVQGTASTAGTYSGNNLKTVVDANGVMQLQMTDAPKFGNITINNGGNIDMGGGKVVNVGGPTTGTDAANKDYVDTKIAEIPGAADALKWDGAKSAYNAAHDGTTPNKIANVANGTAGKDAVNVDQLKGVADVIGGGTAVDPTTGKVTEPTFNVTDKDGNTVPAKTVAEALEAVDGHVNNVDARVTNVEGDINKFYNGTAGLVQQAAKGANLTVGKDTDGAAVDFKGTHGNRKLINVAEGVVSNASKEAINGSQLYGTANSAATIFGGEAKVNGDGTISNPTYNIAGQDFHDVGSALTAVEALAGSGDVLGVVYDSAAKDRITLAGSENGGEGTTISGLKAGEKAMDAVNVQQLADALGGGSIDDNGNYVGPTYYITNQDGSTTTVNNVGDAITKLDGNVTNLYEQIDNGTVGLVKYNEETGTVTVAAEKAGKTVDFTNSEGESRQLKGVDAGVAATDAVNVKQLTDALGGGAGEKDGNYTGPTYELHTHEGDKVTVHNVGDAVTNLDQRTTKNTTDITNLYEEINNGGVGLVKQDAATRDINVAGQTDGKKVNIAGTEGDRTLAGVAAGKADNEAVNVQQLKDAGVIDDGGNTKAVVTYDSADKSSVTLGGTDATAPTAVHNMAAGVADNDGVNVGQMNQGLADTLNQANSYTDSRINDVWQNLGDEINQVNRQANRGIAAASALINVTPYLPGKTAVNAGAASYHGEVALGVGVSRWSDNGRVNFNAGVSAAKGDEPVYRVGIGYVF